MRATDEQVLTAVGRGDAEAFGELYDRFAARALGLIMRIISRRDEAEDVLQEVFWSAWRSAERFDARLGGAAAWMLMLARSRAIDHLRRRRDPAASASDDLATLAPVTIDTANTHDSEAAVHALRQLPAEQREPISLAFYRGLTHAQIAQTLSLPLGTIKTRIRLGMERLRETLELQTHEVSTP